MPILSQPERRILLILFGSCLVAGILHLGIGSHLWIAPWDVLGELLRGSTGGDDPINGVIWQIRLPRVLGCLVAGGLLGCVGAAMQALFRNPLADPYVIGVSSGAAIGGALAILVGVSGWIGGMAGPLLGFATGIGSLGFVLMLAQRRGGISIPTLLLAGVVIGSLLSSLLTLVLLAAGQDTNRVLRWLLGSMTPMSFDRVAWMFAVLVVGGLLLLRQARRLNVLAIGEETALRVGVNAKKVTVSVLVIAAAMTSMCVSMVGMIGFLGLVAPHIGRRLVGVDLRLSLPAAAALGSSLLMVADLVAQRAVPGTELPVGAVTAILGAPVLLVLLRGQG